MLPICTWTVLMGQVLTLGVDMINLLLSFVCCTSSQSRFKRSQGTADAFPWGAWPRDAAVDTHK